MKLTEEQIRFIDAYLKESGMEFMDIRSEMTDHVAAALEEQEGDFRDNFKRYMLKHKKGLLASNRKFRRLAAWKAVRLLLGNLIRLRFLVLIATIFLFTYCMVKASSAPEVIDNFFTGFILCILVFMLYYWYLRLSGKPRFSVVHNVIAISYSIIYVATIPLRIERWVENDAVILGYYGFFLALIIEVLLTYRQLTQKYTLQYGS